MRPAAGRDDVDGHIAGAAHESRSSLRDRFLSPQQIRQSGQRPTIDESCQAGFPHVRVDEQHPLPSLLIGNGEVRGDRRLAIARLGARHRNPLRLTATHHEHRPYRTKTFAGRIIGLVPHMHPLQADRGIGIGVVEQLHHADGRQQRQAEFRPQFLRRPHAVVEHVDDEGDRDAHAHATEENCQDRQWESRGNRPLRYHRFTNDGRPHPPVILPQVHAGDLVQQRVPQLTEPLDVVVDEIKA